MLIVKACSVGCRGFSLPLVAMHSARGCGKGAGNGALRVELLLPGSGKPLAA